MGETDLQERVRELEQALAQKERELADSKLLFNEILEGTLAGFWDWDIPNHTEYLSPTFKQMFGYTDDEIENSPESWQKIIHQEDLPKVFKNFEEHVASKGKVPYDNTVRYYHKDGSIVNVWCRGKVIEWLEDGSPKRMVGSHVEFTKLQKVTQELEEESERLNLIIQGVNAGVWDWNIKEGKEWWSDKFYSLLGYTPDELHCDYQNLINQIHPDHRMLMTETMRDHLQNRSSLKIQVQILTKGAVYRWFELAGQAIWNEKGEATRISGSLIDIDETKKTEALKNRTQNLLTETGMLAKVGGWELNMEDMKPQWSDEVYRIHEVPIGSGPPLDKALDFYPEPDRTRIAELLQKSMEEGAPFDGEFNFITAKNNRIHVRSICVPQVDETGKVIKLLGVFQDITDKKRQEEALQKSLDILNEQNARLQSFAHIVSHNLNSHTSNIKMLTTFLQNASNEEETEQYLGMMDDASGRLETTILDLNEIIKIQNEVDTSRKQVSIKKAYEGALKTLSGALTEADVKLDTTFEIDQLEYIPSYMDSIFLNLISNSIKYKHPERQPEIKVQAYNKDGKHWLSVEDNGIGINLERHGHKVFGMYKTFTKREDSRGLGLFITKTQIEAMGGKINIESTEGKGTKFTIRLN